MITPWRHDLIERLLGILLESIPFELPVEVRCLLLEEPSGSWVLPTPLSTSSQWQSQWMNASLHWMWQEETGTCCVNFLADEGHLPWGVVVQTFQWTLEASHPGAVSLFSTNAMPVPSGETECRRYEPLTVASTSSCDTSIIPVKTFWKIGVLQTLSIEWRLLTLMGTMESRILFLLSPHATFSCDQILWHDHPSSTSSTTTGSGTSRSLQSQEHVRLAHFLQYLESFPTPHLEWNSPPPTSTRTIQVGTTGTTTTTTSFHTLADLFRFAYTWLEDQQPKKSRSTARDDTPPTTATMKGTPSSESSRILPGSINVKKSIGDSLAITGGLAATGASFISPIGVAVSVAAVGVKDGITMAAHKGKETRQGDGYRFGDVARGVMATLKEQRAGKATRDPNDKSHHDPPDGTSSPDGGNRTTGSRSSGIHLQDGLQETNHPIKTLPSETQDHKARYAGIVGSSLGAAAGLALAGPIGFVAGSLIGGTTTQQAMMQRRKDETLPEQQQQDRPNPGQLDQGEPGHGPRDASGSNYETAPPDTRDVNNIPANATDSKPWRFGDNVRNAVQRGKEVTGRDSTSEYQFGDLTRGLFSRRK